MRRLVLAASFVLAIASLSRAADCDACMPGQMCVRHGKEKDEALKAFAKEKSSKDPMKRKAALDKLGKLNDQHMNARSVDVAKAIADMLDDTDSGIRLAALAFLKTNQEIKTSKEEIGKLLGKMIGKISKPKPSGKMASSPAALEWQNTFDMSKECLDGLGTFGGEDVVDYFVKAIDCDNIMFASEAVDKSAGIHSKKLVNALLERFSSAVPASDEDKKHLIGCCAKAFAAQTAFIEPLTDDATGWLKKARAWWKDKEDSYDPPKDGGDGK
ncbi:MAG: hypothetical protein K8T20_08890 [Planctomycetes bacterium]|nr:hypothetical protein [Planctomycetota bacterium]